jgi:hypothetical protein
MKNQHLLELFSTSQAAELLACSPKKLYRQRNSGYLKLGIHFLDQRSPDSSVADLRWNVRAICQAWSIPPEKRQS